MNGRGKKGGDTAAVNGFQIDVDEPGPNVIKLQRQSSPKAQMLQRVFFFPWMTKVGLHVKSSQSF